MPCGQRKPATPPHTDVETQRPGHRSRLESHASLGSSTQTAAEGPGQVRRHQKRRRYLEKATPRGACRTTGAAGRRWIARARCARGKIPAATYSPTRKPCSTIGSEGLNFRVRDGNGWDPFDVATGKWICASACRVRAAGAALDPGLRESGKAIGREETTKPHERLVPVS